MIFKQQIYYAGQYARLSDEDEQDGESCSIDSQRKMMQQFCESKGFQTMILLRQSIIVNFLKSSRAYAT